MTEPHQQPAYGYADPQQTPPPAKGKRKKWPWVVGIIAAFILLAAIFGGEEDQDTQNAAGVGEPVVEDAQPAPGTASEPALEPAPAPAEQPVVDPAPAQQAEPENTGATRAQQNAIRSAQSYLAYTGFSRTGLIDQLLYEDYSAEDAEFAVSHLERNDKVDWNAEAAESAESYLAYTSFSRQGLIDQLIYEGFTPSQAEYGVTAVGY
ncbi:Ltp family lipoprotein [Hoyosella rhizosphaerae]|uniref:Putative host cell surface-exposed lipoprotein Ltp-like HTH region domain-containing protein n=1 Tax=Hoyosella rhizosphaerae TaxID=1755582 RepID=A0A916U7Y0_9ACTN|nr:Ltp family lipoprotein [Hoyosella rhizosphaerae]MBN4926197.1 Ltp family lipoprotein [Hoyosella rhizosphaerae]GGC61349.1 hypothetical protein GCM10011410_12230 [Hoyosella rhizosphaerae]